MVLETRGSISLVYERQAQKVELTAPVVHWFWQPRGTDSTRLIPCFVCFFACLFVCLSFFNGDLHESLVDKLFVEFLSPWFTKLTCNRLFSYSLACNGGLCGGMSSEIDEKEIRILAVASFACGNGLINQFWYEMTGWSDGIQFTHATKTDDYNERMAL